MPRFHVGVSGWVYKTWRGAFYPAGTRVKDELRYLSGRMNSAEVNGSFYSLQRPESYRRWFEMTPPHFVFAVKGPRFISHMKKLRDVEEPLANFFASGVLRLERKLGPILWQFPARQNYDRERFEAFLRMLPRDTREAESLAVKRGERMAGREWLTADARVPLRYAFEVRNPSFFTRDFAALLREYGAALVLADTAGNWPYLEEITADFVYVRLHGAEQLYWSGYTDEQLDWWAERLRAWARGGEPPDARHLDGAGPLPGEKDVFVYFDNDAQAHAPVDAIRLLERLDARSL